MKITHRPIYASAMKRNELSMWIEDHISPVMVALVQLYMFPNSSYENHWRQEVWSNFHSMKRLKSGKLPDEIFILRSGWYVNKDQVSHTIKYVVSKEKSLSPRQDASESELMDAMDTYFSWLARMLSKYTNIAPDEVYDQLDLQGL